MWFFESNKIPKVIKYLLEKSPSSNFNYQAYILLYDFNFLAEIYFEYRFIKIAKN